MTGTIGDINTCREAIKGDPEERPIIDFNKIVPMPQVLRETTCDGTVSDYEWALGKDIFSELRREKGLGKPVLNADDVTFNQILEAVKKRVALYGRSNVDVDQLRKVHENYSRYGFTTWHDWSRANWGTKWNAYEQKEEACLIVFDTAWSTPFPVMEALSKQHPNITFEIGYADEDMGQNCGRYELRDGKMTDQWHPEFGTEDAVRFACKIKGYDFDQYWREITEGDEEEDDGPAETETETKE
jgi:hypothetical protein